MGFKNKKNHSGYQDNKRNIKTGLRYFQTFH